MTSTKDMGQSGFTLVELAIAMVIIGLIVGGILKGVEMIDNSRVATTISQVQGIKSAVTVFRDKYNALPGDFREADTRLPGCLNCVPAATTWWFGDGIVGDLNWGSGVPHWKAQLPAGGMNVPPSAVGDETQLFWMHLLKAGLISGISDESLSGAVPQWGVTHPEAKIGGGFVVGQGDGTVLNIAQTMNALPGLSGLMLQLWALPNTPALTAMPVCGATGGPACVLTAFQAAKIDRKMDDGNPAVGIVQAAATNAASKCVKGFPLPATYLESGSGILKGSAVSYSVCDLAFSLN